MYAMPAEAGIFQERNAPMEHKRLDHDRPQTPTTGDDGAASAQTVQIGDSAQSTGNAAKAAGQGGNAAGTTGQKANAGEDTRQIAPMADPGMGIMGDDDTGMDAETIEFGRLMQERRAKKKKRLIRRIIIVAVIVALIIGFLVYRALRPTSVDGAMSTPTVAVEKGQFLDRVSSTGSIEPISSTVVTPEVDGTIGEVKVQEGASVNAGDVLFTINNDKLDQDVSQADLALRSAWSSVNAAQAQVDQINNSVASARQQGGQEGEAAASAAADQLPSAQSGVESAQLAAQQAQATYDQAVAQSAKRTVTAPVSGTILTLSAVPGASVSGGGSTGTDPSSASSGGSKPLCQISDLSQMKVNVNVNELDITKIAKDQQAKVTFSAISGLTLDAKVDTIASTTSQSGTSDSMSGQGSGGTGYAVRLIIPSPDPRLKPGMTASVKITTQKIDDALMVPTSCLMDDGDGGSMVMLQTNAETHESKQVSVKVKAKNGTKAVVEGNLKKGDKVLVSSGEAASDASTDAGGSVTIGGAAGNAIEKVR
jgi:HlyD family secretion protein